jgi:protein phosphatase
MAEPSSPPPPEAEDGPGRERPSFSDIDAWGLTHAGRVRDENQDHFFLGSLACGVYPERASFGPGEATGDSLHAGMLHLQRVASLAVVADGVGGVAGGEEAARATVQTLVGSVSRFFHDAHSRESEDPDMFPRLLHEAALDCHERLIRRGGGLATTVTLFLGLWPHAYLLQVGDSRCYVFRDGVLTQISRDQTMAQALVDDGVLTAVVAQRSRWAHVLSSAIGGEQAVPVVTRLTREWGTVVLLCSDGLTKHVSDELIRERIASMTSARQVAEQLLDDALEAGGTDNIALVVGRTIRRTGADEGAGASTEDA